VCCCSTHDAAMHKTEEHCIIEDNGLRMRGCLAAYAPMDSEIQPNASTTPFIKRLRCLAAYAPTVPEIQPSPSWTRAQTPGFASSAQPEPQDVAP